MLLSQFPYNVLHWMVHAPREHPGVPFVLLHTFVHEPQCKGSVWPLVSQPADAPQSRYPGLQVPTAHPPATHMGVAFGLVHGLGHAPLHPEEQGPQWATLVSVSVSHASDGSLSQLPKPGAQAWTWQEPEVHCVVP